MTLIELKCNNCGAPPSVSARAGDVPYKHQA